jgi:hypothetical protein
MHTKFWLEKLKGRDHSARLRRRWKDSIKMDLGEREWKGVDWFHLTQDTDQWRAVMNTVMDIQVPQKAENFLTR